MGGRRGRDGGKIGDGRSVLEVFLLFVCMTAAGACSGAGSSGAGRERCGENVMLLIFRGCWRSLLTADSVSMENESRKGCGLVLEGR